MSADMVDWGLAVQLGTRLAGDGPDVPAHVRAEAVAELRAGADHSTALVRDFTGLVAEERTAPVLVVDRGAWIQANADGFAYLLDPIIGKLTEKKGAPTGAARAIGSRVTGAELGGVLGFMGSKVLGQFDPFYGADGVERGTSDRPRGQSGYGADGVERGTSERPRGQSGYGADGDERGTSDRPSTTPHGRLLLVAPNIVQVERELGVDPTDFRLWVCLHEETHRVQFTAVPWMRDHLFAQIGALADLVEPQRFLEEGLRRVGEALRQGTHGNLSMMDLLGGPEQREIIDRITGMMSLLEGHADVVMDGVGPGVIPSVSEIRNRFNERRKGLGPLDRVLRKLLGLDAKMAQYRDGARFVRGVVDKVGMAEFNAVWERPENLPSKSEIADPAAWVMRVLQA